MWNRHTQRSCQYYFGPWSNDPNGECALKNPDFGWLARRDAIHAGVDNVRVGASVRTDEMTLGQLMGRFLSYKRNQVKTGELSLRTLGDYIVEVGNLVGFQKPGIPVSALMPEHFSGYVVHLVETRRLGRHARKRVRAYVNAFLHYGSGNGWFLMPATGVDWKAPATEPDSIRQAKARAGVPDHSERTFTGCELNALTRYQEPTRARRSWRGSVCVVAGVSLSVFGTGILKWLSFRPRRKSTANLTRPPSSPPTA